MRIFLFSHIDSPPKLVLRGTVLYIPAEEKLNRDYSKKESQFKAMGFDKVIVYPIGYFYDDTINKRELFNSVHAVCLGGGNTILFNYLLKKRGLYPYIIESAQQNKFIIGISAGGIVLSPTVAFAIDVDGNPLDENDFSAMNILPFVPKPHYNKYVAFEHRCKWFEKYSGKKIVRFTDDEYVMFDGNEYYKIKLEV